MPRIKIVIQYKGTHYRGWQIQPNCVTIQQVLQKKIQQVFREKTNVLASGRTDAGVHALAQVAHFDVSCELSSDKLQKQIHGVNSILPDDISIIAHQKVADSFHSQKSALKKTYEYFICNSKLRSPFLNEYTWRIPYPLKVGLMKKAAKVLKGEHDFKAFAASDRTTKTTIRKIYQIQIDHSLGALKKIFPEASLENSQLIRISLTGSGFLKNMVRNIVGTLKAVGLGRITSQQFKEILESKDRKQAGVLAPAKGLFLMRVFY